MLATVKLDEDEEMISFDVSSLYTNVPVMEAIETCADFLYSGKYKLPPVDKETFIILAQISSCDVLMLTQDGFYRQVDGLAMGSAPAPHFANGWLFKFDPVIADDAAICERYMDDIIRNIKRARIEAKLQEINNLHPNLKFTCEREVEGKIPFLDMLIINDRGNLSSTWYNKPTDTGLIMNFHALAPKKYKWSVVSGFVYRIHRACSTWDLFSKSLDKAKRILEKNQYPPDFYEPIIDKTLRDIIQGKEVRAEQEQEGRTEEERVKKQLVFVQYRGKCTDDYARALHRINAPCTIVMTLRKLKTVLPSSKPPIEKIIRSGVVYKFTCPHCKMCYVGCTTRHLKVRADEHRTKKAQPVAKHTKNCNIVPTYEDFEILASSSRSQDFLMTLEALWIRELDPTINTKDEYKTKELTIKL